MRLPPTQPPQDHEALVLTHTRDVTLITTATQNMDHHYQEASLYALALLYIAVSLTIPLWVPLVQNLTGQTGLAWVFYTLTYYAYLAWVIFAGLVTYLLYRCPPLGMLWLSLLALRALYFFNMGRRPPLAQALPKDARQNQSARSCSNTCFRTVRPSADGRATASLRPVAPPSPWTRDMFGRVLLVGNGPSLGSRNLGKTIDNFDTVIRFNSFVTKGLEAHTGSKTSIWCHMMQWYHVAATEMMQHKPTGPICYAWNHVVLAPLFFLPGYLMPMIIPPNALTWSISTYWTAHRFLGLQPHQVPTTGFVMLIRMLDFVDQVHLVGFDGYGSGGELHYYEERRMQLRVNAAGALLHDWEREQYGIKKLMEEGKVVLL